MGKVNTQCLEQGEMQAIKAVFVKSLLLVIRIIPSNLLAAAEITERPTRGSNQVSVLS